MTSDGSFRRRLLLHYVFANRRKVAVLTLLTIGATGLQILAPLLCRRFVDAFVAGVPSHSIIHYTADFLGVAVLAQVIAVATTYSSEDLVWTATNRLRLDLIRHALHLDPGFFKEHPPGILIERVEGDVAAISNYLSRFFITVITNCLLVGGITLVLYMINHMIGAAYAVFIAVAVYALAKIQQLGRPWWLSLRVIAAESMTFTEERLSSGVDIVANGGGTYALSGFCQILRKLRRAERNASLVDLLTGSLSLTCIVVGQAMAAGLGAYYYLHGEISLGSIVLLFAYISLMVKPLNDLASQVADASKASVSIDRIQALFETKPKISSGRGVKLPQQLCDIEFRNVVFSYQPGENIIQDVSLTLHPREVVGLVGRTGCGKSTIARLLSRQYDPTHGSIRWGGVDIRDTAISDLRSRIGVVSQEAQLIAASVRDNLSLFDPEVDDSRIIDVIKYLGLSQWFSTLPDGLDTRINGNAAISAGEAQMLAFARVFLKNADVVILDEVTAHVDPTTADRLEAAIGKLLKDRTALIITHDPSILRLAERVLTIQGGHLVQLAAGHEVQL